MIFRKRYAIGTILFVFSTLCVSGQELYSLSGLISGIDGAPLPYTSVFIKQMGTGTISDQDGRYEVKLLPGEYEVNFQFLGYETVSRSIKIVDRPIRVDVVMKEQTIVLQNINIYAGKEDPAYTIMRKAIAKAKFHTQQIDSYSAIVYIKGKGQLTDYPWMAKKALEKEGITKDRLFISESVSEIKYTRPNKFEEKVIAIYSSGNDNNTSPNEYVFGSFYEPEIAETISPLSPKAFGYYRFEYLGSFRDQNYDISKIRVIPRSKGDNVFDGTLFIVEDLWSIHSLSFHTTKYGIDFQIKQIYNPIEDQSNQKGNVWLPVSQQFGVDGSVFGFEFDFNYLATVRDYKIQMNKELILEMTVIDEKIEKEHAEKVQQDHSIKGQQLQERIASGKEITRKELNQLTKEYEKSERKEQPDPGIVSSTKFSIDSLARKKDSLYWASMRPVPLTKLEIRGYVKADSMAIVERKKEEGDTLKPSKNKGFQVWDLFRGDTYRFKNRTSLEIEFPNGGFNTVEGYNLIYRLNFVKRWVKRDSSTADLRAQNSRLTISPIGRYSFSREQASGLLRVDFRSPKHQVTLEGGRYVEQYNSDEPIHHYVNTFTSLFLERNLMKLYERDFVEGNYRYRFTDQLTAYAGFTWARRYEQFNNSDYKLISNKKESYTPNAPVSMELSDTSFPVHDAAIGWLGLEARPWQKYRMRNGFRYAIPHSSPVLKIDYRKGFDGVLGSSVNFDRLELGLRHMMRFGIRGRLDLDVKAGKYFNTDNMYFMDYQHFMGNRTPFVTTDPVGSFRLLDYYLYSTKDEYFSTNVHYHFRKFLVTQIPFVRLTGIQENIFVNYLATPTSQNFTELGYSLDGILRIFRLEAAVAFQNGKYLEYGLRIGITTAITID